MRRKLNLKLVAGTLVGLLLVSTATHALHEYQIRQNAHRLLERGDRAAADKQFDKAVALYRQHLALVPGDPDTVQKMAELFDRGAAGGEDTVDLVLMMEQVLRMKPEQDAFRLRLVHNLIALGRHGDAIDHLRRLLPTSSNPADVHHMIGWCLDAKKDDYADAVKAFEKAVELDPKRIASWTLLAEMHQDRLHQPEEALKAMNGMVAANPESPEALRVRAGFLRRRGDEATAENDLRAAAKLQPDEPEVVLELADVARKRGRLEEALGVLRDAAQRHPKCVPIHQALAGLAIRMGKLDDAVRYLQTGLEHSPGAQALSAYLIDLLIDQKRFAEARVKLDELRRADGRPGVPSYLAARLHIAEGQWTEAIALLESARRDVAAHSKWIGPLNALLGASYRHLGDSERELQAFRRAVDAEPTLGAAILGLAGALLDQGRSDEAEAVLTPLQRTEDIPHGFWPLLARVRLAGQTRLAESQRRWEDVEDALVEAERVEPGNVDVQLLRAEMLAARGDGMTALTLLEKACAEHPDYLPGWSALAELNARLNRHADAERILDRAAAKPGLGAKLELQLAKIRLWTSRGDKADQAKLAQMGAEAAKWDSRPERVKLRRALAQAWQQLAKWDRAAEQWRAFASDAPADAYSRFALVELALKKNDLDAARRHQKDLRELDGANGALSQCAEAAIQIRAARGQPAPLAEARKKLQALEAIHQDWPRIPRLLASISEAEGNYQQAAEEYGRAVELGANDVRTLMRLVELLLARREYGQAESALARYEQRHRLPPDLARLGAESALGLRDQRSAELAVRRAEAAVNLPSRDYRDYLWLGPIYGAAGNQAQAEKAFRTAVDLAPHAPDAWISWVDFLTKTKQRDLATRELDRLKQDCPADRRPLTLARCYEAMHQLDLAAQAFDELLRDRPRDAALLAYAANFYRLADQPVQARRLYERLLDPGVSAPADILTAARRQLAILLAAIDAPKALALIQSNQGDSVADERIRIFVRGQEPGRRAEAIARFQESLRRQPPSAEERVLLAELLEAEGRWQPARTQLAAAVDESPDQPWSLVRFARNLIRLGDWDAAAAVVARLEALEPNSERVRNVKAELAAGLANAKVR